jgi:hypothetical protein
MKKYHFEMSDDEKLQIKDWEEKHDKVCSIILSRKGDTSPYGTIAGGRTYCFTPTSIGTFVSVQCCCGMCFTCDSNL